MNHPQNTQKTQMEDTLFPALSASSVSSADPPLRPGKRGRGATPQRIAVVHAQGRNPRNRGKLTFRYRPLKSWRSWSVVCGTGVPPVIHVADELAQAEALVLRYFEKVGGFRLADDEIVRLTYDALESYSAEEIGWAIDAHAAWLRAGKPEDAYQRHPCEIGNFMRQKVGHWLQQSDEFKRRAANEERVATARRIDELALRKSAPAHAARSVGPPWPTSTDLAPAAATPSVPPAQVDDSPLDPRERVNDFDVSNPMLRSMAVREGLPPRAIRVSVDVRNFPVPPMSEGELQRWQALSQPERRRLLDLSASAWRSLCFDRYVDPDHTLLDSRRRSLALQYLDKLPGAVKSQISNEAADARGCTQMKGGNTAYP